jgi:type I restriction enzyme S subunit
MLPDLIYRLSVRHDRVSSRYLALSLLSDSGRAQIVMDARGSSMSMAKVSGAHVRSWLIAVPRTSQEQQARVAAVRERTSAIDMARGAVSAAIEKLREYRQAIITAAVTGQLDVSSADVSPEPLHQAEAHSA